MVTGLQGWVRRAADAYGLSRPERWDDLGGGRTTNLRLHPVPYVLRIHPATTTPERVAAMQTARRAAAAAGLPAPVPMPTLTGAGWVELADDQIAGDGLRCVELEPYLAHQDRMKTPDLLRAGATWLGRLHDVLAGLDPSHEAFSTTIGNHLPPAEYDAIGRGAARVRGWGRPELTAYADEVERHLDQVLDLEADLEPGIIQLTHGDFWDNNVGFTDGQLTALLDFDFMTVRSRIDDLALLFFFWLLEPDHGLPNDFDRQLLRDLADAYDRGTDRPLTVDERAALPLAVARQPSWLLGRWVLRDPEPDAIRAAHDGAAEVPVAAAVLARLSDWQATLTD